MENEWTHGGDVIEIVDRCDPTCTLQFYTVGIVTWENQRYLLLADIHHMDTDPLEAEVWKIKPFADLSKDRLTLIVDIGEVTSAIEVAIVRSFVEHCQPRFRLIQSAGDN